MPQMGFSRLWDGFKTDKEAMQARNKKAKELKAKGHKVHSWVLRNQLKKYSGFGQPDGRTGHVYMLDWE
jgi:hypothetical protein